MTIAQIQRPITSSPLSTKLLYPNFRYSNPNSFFQLKFLPKTRPNSFKSIQYSRPRAAVDPASGSNYLASTSDCFSAFDAIKPFILSEWKPILYGWTFSAVSVYSLSKIVPKSGQLSSIVTDIGALKREGLVLAAWFLVMVAANTLQHALLWEAALSAACQVRVHVFKKVLERDLAFFESGDGISAGDIAYRITAEVGDVGDTLFSFVNTIVPCALQLSTMIGQMLVISPALSLISALVIPSVGLVIAYLGRWLRHVSKKANLSIAAISAYLNEVLPSILFVKASGAEWSENLRFQRLANLDLARRTKKKKLKAFIPHIVQAVYFGALSVLCAGYLLLSRGSFDTCSMISFITSLVFLIGPIQDVGKAFNEWKQGEPAIERLFELTRFKPRVTEIPDAIDLTSITGEVKFSGISFRYGDGLPLILNEVNLHIKSGETVAFVGPSGGGKTTLVKLLLRLYDPLCGSIYIDGHNIQSLQLGSLRRHVGLVSQDITLFSGTVSENIGYKDLMNGIDMERVRLAAKTANADEFIRSLPEAYETEIGPRGVTLSGGQKQRLAIARALYQNSSILIMDEATSALDSMSELLVRQALERLTEDHTVLVIAHRIETVLMADRIFLLENGRLEEIPRASLINGRQNSLASAGLVI
ncbi:hypothetical protein V2J09_009702 [Rumex salicifolius]